MERHEPMDPSVLLEAGGGGRQGKASGRWCEAGRGGCEGRRGSEGGDRGGQEAVQVGKSRSPFRAFRSRQPVQQAFNHEALISPVSISCSEDEAAAGVGPSRQSPDDGDIARLVEMGYDDQVAMAVSTASSALTLHSPSTCRPYCACPALAHSCFLLCRLITTICVPAADHCQSDVLPTSIAFVLSHIVVRCRPQAASMLTLWLQLCVDIACDQARFVGFRLLKYLRFEFNHVKHEANVRNCGSSLQSTYCSKQKWLCLPAILHGFGIA